MSVEEPKSTLKLKDGDFEVRDYLALVVAQVTVGGDRNAASTAGFRLLAYYIFGGIEGQRSIETAPVTLAPAADSRIAMTAPVTQSGVSGKWTVQFTVPSQYSVDAPSAQRSACADQAGSTGPNCSPEVLRACSRAEGHAEVLGAGHADLGSAPQAPVWIDRALRCRCSPPAVPPERWACCH
jgi:hypothetical protein